VVDYEKLDGADFVPPASGRLLWQDEATTRREEAMTFAVPMHDLQPSPPSRRRDSLLGGAQFPVRFRKIPCSAEQEFHRQGRVCLGIQPGRAPPRGRILKIPC
jgi:hypothetical protein